MSNVYHGNRGKKLEILIDMTNTLLRNKKVADVRKIPTPIKISKVTGNRVIGHLDTTKWVDYSGVYRGKALIFDAKETTTKNFPLSNLKEHQYELLKSWNMCGAYAFLIVAFWHGANEPEAYVLPFPILAEAWKKMSKGGRKSIPIKDFQEKCIRVKSGNGYPIDYISGLKGALEND